ncbi:MAG: MBL fold metallo-hydrolase RNA specificity domain-containing protein [Candidatus Scatomorpha sp.]|jgi:metallo-beta-lactamase family protein
MNKIKVTFIGAAHEVTGSLTLIEANGKSFIVDCGMEQGGDIFQNEELPIEASDIDFVLLTHAHIDHSGNLPLLYKKGFRGKVYANEITTELADIMLRDSANIQMADAERNIRKAKRAWEEEAEPAYTLEHVAGLMKNFVPLKYGKKTEIEQGIEVRFTDIGHLLGSACIEVWMSEDGVTKKMVFSGDVGNINQPIIKDPSQVKDADYVLIESTYGNRVHDDLDQDFALTVGNIIDKVLKRGGNLIIPAFAVGRTQEMLYFMREVKERRIVKSNPDFKVYLDSPLALEATAIFKEATCDYLDADAAALVRSGVNILSFNGLNFSLSADDSIALNSDTEPKVIISASGMCTAGRVRHHLKHNLWRPECGVLFVGYQAQGTLGRILQDGIDEVKLFGEKIKVKAEIFSIEGTSSHADREGLLRWLKGFKKKPDMVFVNHGENEVTDEFAEAVKNELGIPAFAPYSGAVYDLKHNMAIELPQGKLVKKRGEGDAPYVENVYHRELVAKAEELLKTIKSSGGRPNKDMRRWLKELEEIRKDIAV